MRAVQLDEYGPAENYRIVEIPIPEPNEDEVLIKVEKAGIIFADSQMRRGDYVNLPPSLPIIPGREVAGTVEKVGTGVSGVKPGMRVTATMFTGGYAEYATASVRDTDIIPDRVSFDQALVYHINLRVAYLMYYVAGQVKPRDTILLHAAAGGVGTLITQIAKRRANNVIIALSSSDDKLEYCRSQGVDYAINYNAIDYVKEVLRITGGKGVDVSLNSVAGPTIKTDPHAIRPLGRWVIYGHAAGKEPIDPYDVMLLKSITVSIFSVYTVFEREEFRQATDFMENWLNTEALISVSKTYRLEDVIEAHHWMDSHSSYGKIALGM